MNPGAKSDGKRGRGRPKGSGKKAGSAAREPDEILPPPDPEAEREALKPIIKPVFQLLSMAGVRAAEDDAAAIPEINQELMTHSAAGVVVKYMPGVSQHADLICLTLMMSQWAMTVIVLRRSNLAKMRAEGMNGAHPEHGAPAGVGMMQ